MLKEGGKSLKVIDTTYLQLIGSLVNTLINRLIKFYKHEKQDQLVFKQSLHSIQDSLISYEQFKPPIIKYSSILEPLSNYLKLNALRQYLPTMIISQIPQKQSQKDGTIKTSRKRVYSSHKNVDAYNVGKLIGSTASSGSMKSEQRIVISQQKRRGRSFALPNERKNELNSTKNQTSFVFHNYQKQVNKAYDKIIGTIITSQKPKKRKYQCKIHNLVKMSQDPELLQ